MWHLTCGDLAADRVRQLLAEGNELRVLRDDLAVGPLADIESPLRVDRLMDGQQRTLVIAPPDASGSSRAVYFRDMDASKVELIARRQVDASRIQLREHRAVPAMFELQLDRDGQLNGTWQPEEGVAVPVELR